jgi:hypothetical protein
LKEEKRIGLCTPVSYTNKTDRKYVTEILLKVVLNAITYIPNGVVTTINETHKYIISMLVFFINITDVLLKSFEVQCKNVRIEFLEKCSLETVADIKDVIGSSKSKER